MAFTPYNGQLRECSLNGISFPVEHVRHNFSQDIVEHKYPNVPGGNIESLSRNPHRFEVRAIFLTGMEQFKDPTESWSNLYPETFQNVMRVLNDDSNDTIIFQHPTEGRFRVKVVHGTTETVYSTRNGQIIDFELIEDGFNDLLGNQQNVLGNDEIGTATQNAAQVDVNIQTYTSAIGPQPSFTDLLAAAVAPVQATSVAVGTAFAQAGNVIAQVQKTVGQLTALGDPSTSFMLTQMEAIASALNDQRTNNTTSLNTYNVKVPMTLNQVLRQVLALGSNLTIEGIIKLNPQLNLSALLPAGTVVYWQ